MLAAMAVTTLGCGSSPKPTASVPQAQKAADTKPCVMQSAGHDVLRLTVPADTECVPKDGSLI